MGRRSLVVMDLYRFTMCKLKLKRRCRFGSLASRLPFEGSPKAQGWSALEARLREPGSVALSSRCRGSGSLVGPGWMVQRGLMGNASPSADRPAVTVGQPGLKASPTIVGLYMRSGASAPGGSGLPSGDGLPGKGATWLILPVVICLSQRLSHACLSINCLYCETANGSLNQL